MKQYKVTYTEKGPVFDYKRIDRKATFYAISYFKPAGTSLIYFRLDEYNMKTISEDDIISIEE